jgi:hypothetical protein
VDADIETIAGETPTFDTLSFDFTIRQRDAPAAVQGIGERTYPDLNGRAAVRRAQLAGLGRKYDDRPKPGYAGSCSGPCALRNIAKGSHNLYAGK